MSDKACELRDIIRRVVNYLGLKEYSAFIGAGTANFATIPAETGVRLAQYAGLFRDAATTSHARSWQCRLGGHYALKLYERKEGGLLWDMALVNTGWRHWLDAAIFHSGSVPRRESLNLRTARRVARHLRLT